MRSAREKQAIWMDEHADVLLAALRGGLSVPSIASQVRNGRSLHGMDIVPAWHSGFVFNEQQLREWFRARGVTLPTPMTHDDRIARYRQVLAWRAEGKTFVAIGQGLGVSTERARNLWQQASDWQAAGMTPAQTKRKRSQEDADCEKLERITASLTRVIAHQPSSFIRRKGESLRLAFDQILTHHATEDTEVLDSDPPVV